MILYSVLINYQVLHTPPLKNYKAQKPTDAHLCHLCYLIFVETWNIFDVVLVLKNFSKG